MPENHEPLIDLTAMVVAAYVRHNSVAKADLAGLIERTHVALTGLSKEPEPEVPEKPLPAVPIKKSVTPDAIICLEDGRAFKSLKRHLRAAYDMSPAEYRAKWGLPADYPMVAASYAEARSTLAKSYGLGQQRRKSLTKARGKAT